MVSDWGVRINRKLNWGTQCTANTGLCKHAFPKLIHNSKDDLDQTATLA